MDYVLRRLGQTPLELVRDDHSGAEGHERDSVREAGQEARYVVPGGSYIKYACKRIHGDRNRAEPKRQEGTRREGGRGQTKSI